MLSGPRTSLSSEVSGETGMTRLETSHKVAVMGLVYDPTVTTLIRVDWSLLDHILIRCPRLSEFEIRQYKWHPWQQTLRRESLRRDS